MSTTSGSVAVAVVDGVGGGARHPDDPDVGLALERRLDALGHHLVVVDDEDADHAVVAEVGHGTIRSTR